MPESGLIEACDPRGWRLQLEFAWQVDRYRHTLRFVPPVASPEPIPVAVSQEGSPTDDWPASPAFQQLLIEPRGALHVALLVGMSGTSHWSASIEPVPDMAAFDFDVACRLRATASELRSSYSDVWERWSSGPENPGWRFTLSETPTVVAEPHVSIERLVRAALVRRGIPDARPPCTLRWRYRWSVEPADILGSFATSGRNS